MPRPKITYPAYLMGDVAGILLELAEASLRESAARRRKVRRRRIGETLHPGIATPLWNELLRQAQPLLRRWGEKAQLARQLGIDRQRLNHCLKAGRACLDGERTLLLLCWVAARQRGASLPLRVQDDLVQEQASG